MRLAYADPPYLGSATRYYRDHPDAARWNEPETHVELRERLAAEFDGWALSCSSSSLSVLMAGAPPEMRVAAWVKPFAAFKANVRCAYTWEPVLFVPGRDSSKEGAPITRDHLSAPITMVRGLAGAKPEAFCRWVLLLLGYVEGDTVEDVFPGTGVMGRTLAQGTLL
jgi:hypothetical protein